MRKIISFMHTSLVGFVAGPSGEMSRIKDEAPKVRKTSSEDAFGKMFEYAGKRISKGDTGIIWTGNLSDDERLSELSNISEAKTSFNAPAKELNLLYETPPDKY